MAIEELYRICPKCNNTCIEILCKSHKISNIKCASCNYIEQCAKCIKYGARTRVVDIADINILDCLDQCKHSLKVLYSNTEIVKEVWSGLDIYNFLIKNGKPIPEHFHKYKF
jgi:hypothetical protein